MSKYPRQEIKVSLTIWVSDKSWAAGATDKALNPVLILKPQITRLTGEIIAPFGIPKTAGRLQIFNCVFIFLKATLASSCPTARDQQDVEKPIPHLARRWVSQLLLSESWRLSPDSRGGLLASVLGYCVAGKTIFFFYDVTYCSMTFTLIFFSTFSIASFLSRGFVMGMDDISRNLD